jgi:Ca2+-binding EF-hand superfamily protein
MFAGLPEDELDVEIHRVFYSFDSDGNMRLDKDELANAFDVMGLRLSFEQLDATFEHLDHNGNGTIEADEFCRMVRERE